MYIPNAGVIFKKYYYVSAVVSCVRWWYLVAGVVLQSVLQRDGRLHLSGAPSGATHSYDLALLHVWGEIH